VHDLRTPRGGCAQRARISSPPGTERYGCALEFGRRLRVITVLAVASGCSHAVIGPGHLGLLFDPSRGGLQKEVLQPGTYPIACAPFRECVRIEDFDVTYTTHREELEVITAEAIPVRLRIAVITRPIVLELYNLDREIGPQYYEEVIQPQAKVAARSVFSRQPAFSWQTQSAVISNAIEDDLRQRTLGKHVEISSVTIEEVTLPPELVAALERQQAARKAAAARPPTNSNALPSVMASLGRLRRRLDAELELDLVEMNGGAHLRATLRSPLQGEVAHTDLACPEVGPDADAACADQLERELIRWLEETGTSPP
jgi:hypothetical protein